MADKKVEVFAAIIIGCVGVFFVFGMPFFVGGIISELGLSQSQANLVSSAEIAGMALSSMLGFFGSRDTNGRPSRILGSQSSFWETLYPVLDFQKSLLSLCLLWFDS